jgi:hypothetical protein
MSVSLEHYPYEMAHTNQKILVRGVARSASICVSSSRFRFHGYELIPRAWTQVQNAEVDSADAASRRQFDRAARLFSTDEAKSLPDSMM